MSYNIISSLRNCFYYQLVSSFLFLYRGFEAVELELPPLELEPVDEPRDEEPYLRSPPLELPPTRALG